VLMTGRWWTECGWFSRAHPWLGVEEWTTSCGLLSWRKSTV